jgi:glycogen synthase
MKILLAVPEYPPYHIGGGGEVYKNLAENYSKLGHDVVVIYGYYPSKSWFFNIKVYEKNNIKFYQIPEIPHPKNYPFLRTVMPPNLNSFWNCSIIL